MITYSKYIEKEFKTESALKGQLTKSLKKSREDLKDMLDCYVKGSSYYLGEPIGYAIREKKVEIFRLKLELKSIREISQELVDYK